MLPNYDFLGVLNYMMNDSAFQFLPPLLGIIVFLGISIQVVKMAIHLIKFSAGHDELSEGASTTDSPSARTLGLSKPSNCPQCGAPLPSHSRTCAYCGTTV